MLDIKDSNFADRLLKTIETTVDGDEIEEEWELQVDQDLLGTQDDKARKKRYSSPYFYFLVKAGGLEQKSGLLKYKDWIDIKLEDEEGNALGNRPYVVRLPNGEIREGTLDDNGEAQEEQLPPGRSTVEFPPPASDTQSDSEQSDRSQRDQSDRSQRRQTDRSQRDRSGGPRRR